VEAAKKIFFLSDAHLGYPNKEESIVREKKLVAFLDSISDQAQEIYLLGDMFDFWYEYNSVVPRGYVRFLGKLTELTDKGVVIHFFKGNHDIWAFDYLSKEIGLVLHNDALHTAIGTKNFFLAHGDGTNKADRNFLFLKRLFHNKILQWFFTRLHPNFAFYIASRWSRHSRLINGSVPFENEQEPMVSYCRENLMEEGLDYIIFGHRHYPVNYPLNDSTNMIILGDWITQYTYGEFDGVNFELKKF
jgi:UDP-2,3-diacylglucosamine hydrolase